MRWTGGCTARGGAARLGKRRQRTEVARREKNERGNARGKRTGGWIGKTAHREYMRDDEMFFRVAKKLGKIWRTIGMPFFQFSHQKRYYGWDRGTLGVGVSLRSSMSIQHLGDAIIVAQNFSIWLESRASWVWAFGLFALTSTHRAGYVDGPKSGSGVWSGVWVVCFHG